MSERHLTPYPTCWSTSLTYSVESMRRNCYTVCVSAHSVVQIPRHSPRLNRYRVDFVSALYFLSHDTTVYLCMHTRFTVWCVVKGRLSTSLNVSVIS